MLLSREAKDKLRRVVERSRRDPAFFARAFFGLDLAPRQVEALNLGGRVQTMLAGRRFGKSLIRLIDAVHGCVTGKRRDWYVTGPSLDQAKLYFTELERFAGQSVLLGRLLKGIKWSPFPEATFITGSHLLGRSTARDGVYLRGKGADGVVITEAAFVKDRVYQDVIRAMVLDRRGVIRAETTPNGMNYVHRLFQQGLEDPTGYYRSFHATAFDNPRLDPEELERIRREIPELAWRVEYLAEFVEDDTWVFPWAVLQEIIEDYTPAEGPGPGRRYSIGVDLAKYQDYTAIIVLDVTRPPYPLAEYHRYQGRLYAHVAAHVNELQARYGARVYLDATGVGDAVAEQVRNCEAFVFSERSRQDLLSNLVVLAQQKKLLLPAAWTVLRDELRYFRNVRHGTRVKPEGTGGYLDDTVMALALAAWDVRGGGVPVDAETKRLFEGASMYE